MKNNAGKKRGEPEFSEIDYTEYVRWNVDPGELAEDADEYDEDTEEYDDDPDEMYEDREESEKDRKKLNR